MILNPRGVYLNLSYDEDVPFFARNICSHDSVNSSGF